MNNKQKIIISVTGIFLVLLLLVGLTYGYFLTKITGNNNSKSISVSTANLELVYEDGNGVLEVGEVITPGDSISFKTTSGDIVDSKTFKVTNKGNATTDYVVVIEDVKITYTNATVVDGVSYKAGDATTFVSNDFRYTLTCTTDGSIACSGVENEVFPMNGGIVVGNNLEVGKTHTYTLKMEYLETNTDQSADMNKSFTAKLNIKDISTINPYSKNTDSLAYNIINNSVLGKNGTTLEAVPLSEVASSISQYGTGKYNYETVSTSSLTYGYMSWLIGDTASAAQSGSSVSSYEVAVGKYVYDQISKWTKYLDSYDSSASTVTFRSEEMLNEKTLSVATDDYGTSYYYRGTVEDNYVEFNNMCWRIVRIEGDGSIKITLAAQKKCSEMTSDDMPHIGTGNYGYTYDYVTNSSGATSSLMGYVADYLNGQTDKENSIKTQLDAWLTSSGIDTSKLKQDTWCLGNLTDAYDSSGTLLTSSKNDLMYDRTTFYYDTYRRLTGLGTTPHATLKCSGENYETFSSYIGALTADEIVFAGGKVNIFNTNFYLSSVGGIYTGMSLSLGYFDGLYDRYFLMDYRGDVGSTFVNRDDFHLRPAVSLASNITISSGNGTQTDPYVIK